MGAQRCRDFGLVRTRLAVSWSHSARAVPVDCSTTDQIACPIARPKSNFTSQGWTRLEMPIQRNPLH